MITLLALTALAGGGEHAGACGVTDGFEVLAVDPDSGLVAYKHVYSVYLGDRDPVDCGYAGMSTTPTSGVELGVYDTRTGRATESWTVYAAARWPEECLSHDASTKALADAKARFAALGLDLSAPPARTAIEPGTTEIALPTANGTLPVRLAYDRLKDDDAMQQIVIAEVWTGDTRAHRVVDTYGYVAGGALEIDYIAAMPMGRDALLVERHHTWSMRDLSTCYELVRVPAPTP